MNVYRMRRAAALTVSISTLLVPFMSVFPAIVAGRGITEVWWTPTSFVLIVGAAIVMLAAAIPESGRSRAMFRSAVLLAAANLTALALWFPAWTHLDYTGFGSPPVWSANTVVLPAVALATLVPVRWAAAYLVVGVGMLAVAQQKAGFGGHGTDAYLNQMLTASLVAVFLAMLGTAMGIARSVDATRAVVLTESVVAAARAARVEERRRLDVVLRDKVIAVLREIVPGRPDERHRRQAQAVLDELDGADVDPMAAGFVSASDAVVQLREAVIAFGDHMLVSIEASEDAVDLPVSVVDALGAALVEAVGNSVVHAGPGASTAVVGLVAETGVRIWVVDDGRGFEPDRIAPDRSGIVLGIRQRMESL
ncbi:MAG: ATP-binding protein, partial [Gordonia sp. (in: high G+C Gram-positive bacteria)]|nr:ATP-binding protein [Gordonia sp. (in: high G+C Gram-positive bacteria)]